MMNVAILGCGGIAQKMAKTVVGVEETYAYAVAARDLGRAQEFAKEFGFEKAYGSYEEMLADPAVELVYVATPHSHHYRCVKMCLEAGKHVLCEKAFTVNASQAKELLELAESKKLLLGEAIWTRYMPSRFMIDEILESGIIGEPVSTMADLSYNISHVERIVNPDLAGGALLDLGVYMLNFARMIFKAPITNIVGTCQQLDNDVDLVDHISIYFEDGTSAQLQANAKACSARRGSIFGTKGYIEITNTNDPEKIEVFDKDYKLIASYDVPEQITGFEYELLSCVNAIKAGQIECPEMPHSEILYIMELMDSLRETWGYEIPDVR